MECQKTVAAKASLSGISLHTGMRAHITLRPAPVDTGIVFVRKDLKEAPSVRAIVENVVDVKRGTTIACGAAKVHTVEHVLAALNAAGVDNAFVDMDGPEPPIVDGSAMPYVELVLKAGIKEQDAKAYTIMPSESIIVEEGETKIILFPCDELRITCIISYGATPLDAQYYSSKIDCNIFKNEIAPARTFCLYNELEALIAHGLVKGGSLDNAIVLHDGAIICKEDMNFANELVRHKVLDIVGDLYLAGARVKAHIVAIKPGHPANISMVRKIVSLNNALRIAI